MWVKSGHTTVGSGHRNTDVLAKGVLTFHPQRCPCDTEWCPCFNIWATSAYKQSHFNKIPSNATAQQDTLKNKHYAISHHLGSNSHCDIDKARQRILRILQKFPGTDAQATIVLNYWQHSQRFSNIQSFPLVILKSLMRIKFSGNVYCWAWWMGAGILVMSHLRESPKRVKFKKYF